MAMTEEKILQEAARIQAARRRRVERACDRCGKTYEGLIHSKYCSDRCRVAASRERRFAASARAWDETELPEARGKDESLDDYFARTRELTRQYWAPNPVPPEVEQSMAAFERLLRTSERIMRGRVFDDSTEIVRREREARSEYLANL